MPAVTDLYTTIKNTSGATRKFGFIPPHGKELTSGQEYTVFGNFVDHLMAGGRLSMRKKAAVEAALNSGAMELLATPRVILKDTAQQAALANPTVQTTAATSTGGSLATGYYKFAYTFVSTWGESTVGTSLSAALQIPDATNDRAVITVPAADSVTNCTAVNVYATAMAASSGAVDATTLRKVGQVTGATTSLNLDTLPAVGPSNPAPPSSNTTKGPTMVGIKSTNGTLGYVDVSTGRYTG